MISVQKQREIIDALRRGTVPKQGLEHFAVGLDKFIESSDYDLALIENSGSAFKAVRGEYGCGKTFFVRWIQERAKQRGFAVSEIQISETDTPLHKQETVYRRLIEHLSISGVQTGAFQNIIDSWFYTLEEDVLSTSKANDFDERKLMESTDVLMEQRLTSVTRHAPAFTAALRGYRKATLENKLPDAEGLIAWLSGQPHVTAGVKKNAGIKGEIDHFAALNFLQGLLIILKDTNNSGLVLVLDEVETLQRVRTDVRDKGLNSLRQLIDEIDAGRFPGLYLLITGTPAFFDGPQGIQRSEPLAQRLHTDFLTDSKYDNPRAVQIRLKGFDLNLLSNLGCRIRDIYAEYSSNTDRLVKLADNNYITELAKAVTGNLGGKVGIAPRLFLKKLISDILDRIDQFPEFDPHKDYALTFAQSEMNEIERNAQPINNIDDINLDI